MKGVLDMRLTHDEMCAAVRLWLRTEVRNGISSENTVPFVTKVSQSKRNCVFTVTLADTNVKSVAKESR